MSVNAVRVLRPFLSLIILLVLLIIVLFFQVSERSYLLWRWSLTWIGLEFLVSLS